MLQRVNKGRLMQAQQILLDNGAVPLMVNWLAAGPEQEVATAAARALAKAAKGNRGIQTAICDARALPPASLPCFFAITALCSRVKVMVRLCTGL